jgi:hypothetical protein
MAAGKLAAAQQLIKAMAAVNNEAWSAAELTQLYTDASSPARHLAPAVGEGSHIVPLKSSDIKVPGSTPLAGHVLTRLVWVLRGLQERHFTASEELTQQACELVCTLADVLYFIFFPWLSRPSSSRSQQGKATAFGRFLKLGEDAGKAAPRVVTCIKLPSGVLHNDVRIPPCQLKLLSTCLANYLQHTQHVQLPLYPSLRHPTAWQASGRGCYDAGWLSSLPLQHTKVSHMQDPFLLYAERIMFALADTAKQLNQHVFQRAASVPFQELDSAALCCQRIASLLVEWRNELADAGTVSGSSMWQLPRTAGWFACCRLFWRQLPVSMASLAG